MAITLDNIVTEENVRPPRICLYGVGGVGKTKFASMAPKPVFACTEDGLGDLAPTTPHFKLREKDPVLRTWVEILQCVELLRTSDHDRQTFVLDTLDFAEPLLWAYTAAQHGKDDIEEFGYGKGYVYALDEARLLFRGLDMLRNERGMGIVLLAHSETKRYEAPDHEAYDRYKLRLHDRFANFVHDWVDILLFANMRVHVVKDVQGSGKSKRETARGIGAGERTMYTEERPAWWAKNRYRLPTELPFEEDHSWATLMSAIADRVTKKEPVTKTKKEKQSA